MAGGASGCAAPPPTFKHTLLHESVMFLHQARRNLQIGGQRGCSVTMALLLSALMLPALAAAQGSPFLTGATALQNNILGWLTPIAVILVMALGAMAMANRLSWGWCIGAILGIAIAFGAPQIVAWVRGMFGV
jgi:type IV secretion system protein VirB2